MAFFRLSLQQKDALGSRLIFRVQVKAIGDIFEVQIFLAVFHVQLGQIYKLLDSKRILILSTTIYLVYQCFWYMSMSVCIREVVAQRCSVKKVFLKIFEKLTGKHLRQSLFLIKLQGSDQRKKIVCFRLTGYQKRISPGRPEKKLFFHIFFETQLYYFTLFSVWILYATFI